MLQFVGYLVHVVLHDHALIYGQVQSLIGSIREKSVLSHLLGQWGAVQEIRMEQQCVSFRHRTVLNAVNAYGLSRREAYNCFIIEIILRFPIVNGAAHRLFQEKGIKTECHFIRRLVFRAVEMHNTDQRMLGLKPEKPVILFYGICFYYFHARKL